MTGLAARPRPAARVERGVAGAVAWLLALLAVSVVAGAVLVIASGASATWLVLIVMAGATAVVVAWSDRPRDLLLHGYLFTLPIYLTKSILAARGVYAPQLAITLSDLFLLPMLALWLADRWFVAPRPIHRPVGVTASTVYVAWMWASAFLPVDMSAGVSAAITFTKYWLAYIALTDLLDTPARLRTALGVIGLGILPNLLFSTAQFVTGQPLMIQGAKYATVGTNLVFSNAGGVTAFRPSALLGHPNVLADYATLLLPPLVALLLAGRRVVGVRTTWTALALAGAAAFMLVVSLSRGGWIAATCALLLVLVVGWRRGLVRGRQVGVVALVGALGLAAVTMLYPAVLLRITQSDARSSESRLVMMDQAWLIIRRNPVFGVGLGGYNAAAQVNIPRSFASVSPAFQDKIQQGVVHNKYLLVFAESGVVGLAAFLATFAAFMRAYLRAQRWPDASNAALALGLWAAIAGQLVFYLFDHFYADVRVESLWVTFALLAASLRLRAGSDTASAAQSGPRRTSSRAWAVEGTA